jgi:hypothetical protein
VRLRLVIPCFGRRSLILLVRRLHLFAFGLLLPLIFPTRRLLLLQVRSPLIDRRLLMLRPVILRFRHLRRLNSPLRLILWNHGLLLVIVLLLCRRCPILMFHKSARTLGGSLCPILLVQGLPFERMACQVLFQRGKL